MTSVADCEYCSFKGQVIFDETLVSAILPENPAVPGHVVIIPKRHIQILEQASDDVITALFDAANKVSVALFEGLRAQGTNVIVTNGLASGQKIPHLSVHVIPRVKDDGLSFVWPTRKLSDEQMSMVESQIRENMFSVGLPEISERKEEQEQPIERKPAKKVDYFLKQLRRMP